MSSIDERSSVAIAPTNPNSLPGTYWLALSLITSSVLRASRALRHGGARFPKFLPTEHTLINPEAKLVATWEDVWEELSSDIQGARSSRQCESQEPETASLFPDEATSPHEKQTLKLTNPDESSHMDQPVELLENEMPPWGIPATVFELEPQRQDTAVAGKIL